MRLVHIPLEKKCSFQVLLNLSENLCEEKMKIFGFHFRCETANLLKLRVAYLKGALTPLNSVVRHPLSSKAGRPLNSMAGRPLNSMDGRPLNSATGRLHEISAHTP